jgi:hypothetical protein
MIILAAKLTFPTLLQFESRTPRLKASYVQAASSV